MPSGKRTRQRKRDQATQEKRDKLKRCYAAGRSGKPCMAWAGAGTDHPGRGRCHRHAGEKRIETVLRNELEGQRNGMAKARDVTPGQALAAVLRLAAGQLAYTTYKVGELKERDLFVTGYNPDSGAVVQVPHHWMVLQRECMQDLARYAKLAADAGIAERGAAIQERQTEIVAGMLEKVVDALDLTPKQRAALPGAIRTELAVIDGDRLGEII